MATIGDVAKKAGVSTTLVSRYLNQIKGVSPASKERIEAAIRELNYVPDESARMLVRRRGGVSPAPTVQLPAAPAIAIVCEDVDFQLLSALYLGAKHAVWAEDQHRAYQVLLLPVVPDDEREEDEKETLAYVREACRGMIAVGESAPFLTAVMSVGVPAITLTPERGAWVLHRGSQQLREALSGLEECGERLFVRLCEKITEGDQTVSAETSEYHFTVIEDENQRSPLGRSLQSHLL